MSSCVFCASFIAEKRKVLPSFTMLVRSASYATE